MFLGTVFAGTAYAASNTAVSDDAISTIILSNVIADDFFVTKDILIHFDWQLPETWDFNVYLMAQYQNSTHAGNIEYSKDNVSMIKIKRRYVGEFVWKTIYEQPVNISDDFSVNFYDYYNPHGKPVEYSYVVVFGGSDVNVSTETITPEFYSYFICGKNGQVYPMIVDVDNSITYNRDSQILKSPGSKYPYVINNGMTQYYSGTLNVTFIEMNNNCNLDVKNAWKYRREIDEFLANGEPKIIKSFEGDIWMVNTPNSFPRSNSGHYQLQTHQIEWVECGDPFSIADLYDNGFINTDVDREV